MGKDDTAKQSGDTIEATLLKLARPKMTPKELLKAAQTEEEFSVATAKVQRAEARIGVAQRKETQR